MKCPECGNECRKGMLKAVNEERMENANVIMAWYPEKIAVKKSIDGMNLGSQVEGYYCETCGKVFAVMSEKDDIVRPVI